MEDFSRREFFKKLVPRSESNAEATPLPEAESGATEQSTLSRRSFVKFLGAVGAAVALEQIGVKTAEAQENKEAEKNPKVENQKPIPQETPAKEPKHETSDKAQKLEAEQEDKENSFSETAIEQSLMMGAKYIANAIFEKLKIEHGNQSLSDEKIIEYLRDKPISGLLEAGVLGPIIEEALFRALPASFIDKNDKRNRWEIGIPTSLLFALAHNFKKEESGELQFAKSVPTSQFMGGLFYWYLMREKGYSHATMAHSMNNAIPVSIGILLFKTYPEEKALKITRKIFGMKEGDKISGENLPPSSAKPSNPSETD